MRHASRVGTWFSLVILGVLAVPAWGQQRPDEPPRPESEPPILTLDTGGLAATDLRAIVISHDDRLVAVGCGKEVRIWNVQTGDLQFTLRGYREPDGFNIGNVNALAFSTDNRFLVVGVTDNTELGSTRVYDLSQPAAPLKLLPGHTGCTIGAVVSPDGRYFATYGCAGVLEVFEVDLARSSAERTVEIPLTKEAYVKDVSEARQRVQGAHYFGFPFDDDWLFCRDKHREFVASRRTQRLYTDPSQWPARLQAVLKWEQSIQRPQPTLPGEFTTPVAMKLDQQPGYVRGGMTSDKGTGRYWVGVWDYAQTEPRVVYDGHRYYPKHVAWSTSRKLCASADELGELHVWEADTGRRIRKIASKNRELYGVKWVSNDKLLISDQHYDASRFTHNAFGPLTLQWDLKTLQLTPLRTPIEENSAQRALLARPVVDVDGRKVQLQVSHSKVNTEVWGLELIDVAGTAQSGAITYEFDRPMAYTVLKGKSVVVGTLHGKLAESALGSIPTTRTATRTIVLNEGQPNQTTRQVEEERTVLRHAAKQERTFQGHTSSVMGVAVSPDKLRLASVSTDGTIRIWDLDAEKEGAEVPFQVEGNRVDGITPEYEDRIKLNDTILRLDGRSFYERRRRFAAGEYKPGQIVALDLQRGKTQFTVPVTLVAAAAICEPLATCYLAADGEWIAWTPKGFYATSENGEKYVGWHVNQGREQPARFFGVGQFRKELNRPAEVTAALGLAENVTVTARRFSNDAPIPTPVILPAADFREIGNVEARFPPEVRLLSPKDQTTTDDAMVRVEFEVVAAEQLREQAIHVSVNGQPLVTPPQPTSVAPVKGAVGTAGRLMKAVYEAQIPLQPKTNVVTILAAHNKAESNTVRLEINRSLAGTGGMETAAKKKRLFVLAIGVGTFKNEDLTLRVAARDAEDFAKAFKAQEGKLYSKVVTRVLTDEKATVPNVKDGMEWLSESVTPDDVVFVLLSTHGFYDKFNVWRMLCTETDMSRLNATTVTFDEIRQWFEYRLPASAVMFVDACHATGVLGANTPGAQGLRPSPWQGTGRLIYSSCQADEESLELQKHGAFTEALLEAFAAPDKVEGPQRDGFLSAHELAEYLRHRVPELTRNKQHPTICDPGTVSSIQLIQFDR